MFQQWLKLSRHYGISNIVILHKMGDLDAVGDADSKERNLAYSIVGDIENKFIFRVNHQEAASLRERLNIPATHVEDARRLRMGVFLAYVGQYSYVVDCFATSTPWEYELFKTDDAVQSADRDDGALELLAPGRPRAALAATGLPMPASMAGSPDLEGALTMSLDTHPRAYATVTGPTATFTTPDGRERAHCRRHDEDIRHMIVQRAADEARRAGTPVELVTSGDRGDHHLLVATDGEIGPARATAAEASIA